MPIDPSILLQGQGVAVPNPLTGMKDIAQIANLMGEVQNRNLLGQATQQKLDADAATQRALPDVVSSGWHPDAINAALKSDPRAGPGILKEWGDQVARLKTLTENAKTNLGMLAGEAQWIGNKPDVTWQELSPIVNKAVKIGLSQYIPPPQPDDTPQIYAKRYAGALMSPENQSAYFNSISEDNRRMVENMTNVFKANTQAREAEQQNIGLSPDNILYQKLSGGPGRLSLPTQGASIPNPMYAPKTTPVQPSAPPSRNWDLSNPQKTIAQINTIPDPQDRQTAMEQFTAALGPTGNASVNINKPAQVSSTSNGPVQIPNSSGFEPKQIGPSVIQKGNLAETEKTLKDMADKRASALQALPLLNSMEALDKNGILSGGIEGSGWYQQLANTVLSVAPGLSDEQRAKLANTQTFNKDTSNIIAQGLKSIGGGRILASEISLLQNGNPNPLQQPEARQAIYGLLRNQLQTQIDAYPSAQKHVNAGNYDLSAWSPPSFAAPLTPSEIMKQKQSGQTNAPAAVSASMPPASQNAGKFMKSPNGIWYKSDGTNWNTMQ